MKKSFILLIYFGVSVFIFQCKNSEKISLKKLWTDESRVLIINELNRTTNELMNEIENISQAQWNFKENSDRWSINEIVEHLEIQNELHYRQIIVVVNSPEMPQYIPLTDGKDSLFSNYAIDTLKRQAKWFLEPIGRFCTKAESISAFNRARTYLVAFVENTDVDLRKHFSFSTQIQGKPLEEIKPKEVFDLHQLLLLGIAHTDRHLKQIREIKNHATYILLQ